MITRVISGSVLIAMSIGAVWFAPGWLFLLIAILLAALACREFAALARASDLHIPGVLATIATALTCAAFSRASFGIPLDLALMSALVVLGSLSLASWSGGRDAVASASAALMPVLYVGLPVGAMVGIREQAGPQGLFLLMLTVMVSDSSQYFVGRAFGRRPLAPRVSPKKTLEGAYGGFVCGTALLAVVGHWWLPSVPVLLRVLLGATLVALGIAGDLFESMLKRSAGVKDSSALIPGHGGVLDRIDALLFTAPVYYVVITHV